MNKILFFATIALSSMLGLVGGVQEYHYDANGRLGSITGSVNESYTYDARGNVAEIQKAGEVIQFEYDKGNQLKQRIDSEGTHTFVYDRAGRLIAENLNGQPVARYTYGFLDKVTSVERDGQITKFRYNGDGMLVEKEYPDGRLEKWSWDGMALIARGDERYINEPHASGGVPIMSLTSKGVRYHTSDYLGTTLWSTDAQGNLTDRYEATPYGQGSDLQNDPAARFTGKPYDKDLGAFVFPFRNYDSKNVRWMSVDPSGFPDGPNAHFYACNPLKNIDPLGLATEDFSYQTTTVDNGFVKVKGSYEWNFSTDGTKVGNCKISPGPLEGNVFYSSLDEAGFENRYQYSVAVENTSTDVGREWKDNNGIRWAMAKIQLSVLIMEFYTKSNAAGSMVSSSNLSIGGGTLLKWGKPYEL